MFDFVTVVTPFLVIIAGTPERLLLFVLACLSIVILLFVSQPKRYYFIRHGETLLNKQHVKQGADGALSENGVLQAKRVGLAFKKLPVAKILTSPYERATQTAELIHEVIKKPVKVSPLLAERRNASETLGKSTTDPEVVRIMGLTSYGYHEDKYRFSDEENFEDLRVRAKKCLSFLESEGGRQLMVVTHHAFLQMLLSYMLYRDKLHAADYVKLAYFNPADNGGVTVCDFHPWRALFSPKQAWEIITYNQSID